MVNIKNLYINNIKTILLVISGICGLSMGPLLPVGSYVHQKDFPYIGRSDAIIKAFEEIEGYTQFAMSDDPVAACEVATAKFLNMIQQLPEQEKKKIDFKMTIVPAIRLCLRGIEVVSIEVPCSLHPITVKRLQDNGMMPVGQMPERCKLTFATETKEHYGIAPQTSIYYGTLSPEEIAQNLDDRDRLSWRKYALSIGEATAYNDVSIAIKQFATTLVPYAEIHTCDNLLCKTACDDPVCAVFNLSAVSRAFATGDTESCIPSLPLTLKQIHEMIACPLLHLGQQ